VLTLADILGHHEAESLIVCILVVLLVSALIYVVVTYGFKQPWGGMAAAVVFVVGALLCLL